MGASTLMRIHFDETATPSRLPPRFALPLFPGEGVVSGGPSLWGDAGSQVKFSDQRSSDTRKVSAYGPPPSDRFRGR